MGKYLAFGSIGFELVGLVLGSYYLSEYLDKMYHTKGMIFVVLVFGSIITWLTRVIWLLRRFQKEDEKSEKKDGGDD